MLPKAPDGFEWVVIAGRPALVCRPLAEVAPHFFTTREWPLGSAASTNGNWQSVADAAGARRLIRLAQVHGADVIVHRRGAPSSDEPPAADIIVSNDSEAAIAVQAADCVPLLVADRRQGVVAAAHAGWRGLAAGVPEVTVAALARAFGSRPADLVAVVGPSIGACCYEVGEEVRARFVEVFGEARASHWFTRDPVVVPPNKTMPGVVGGRDGKWFFDGWAASRDQLSAAGVSAVHVASLCTASHPEALCSYRRDGAAAGRLAAAIRGR